jgi:phosphate starvation-inducible protein PhoH and related proteins
VELSITLEDPRKAGALFGPGDRNLRLIRDALGVQIYAQDRRVNLSGPARAVSRAAAVLDELQRRLRQAEELSPGVVEEALRAEPQADGKPPRTPRAAAGGRASQPEGPSEEMLDVYAAGQAVRPKTPGQKRYLEAVRSHDLIFCMGPAGTGKTYLAVAIAVHMLKHQQARRLILVRPAVEAGEKLGFLPGDMQAKVNPYLRPLFDALHDMMEYDQIRRFLVNDLIEVIPLAFMRGRTLNDSVIILDEAQNTTASQMLMFLTRMGHGSKMIVTGDDSQIDLPEGVESGLLDAAGRLEGIKGLAFVRLEKGDIVRHRLVQSIVQAYAERPLRPSPGRLGETA